MTKTLITIVITIIVWEWFKKKAKLTLYGGNEYYTLRFFGRGLQFRNIKKHPARFSEREGYLKYIQIGKWRITKIERV